MNPSGMKGPSVQPLPWVAPCPIFRSTDLGGITCKAISADAGIVIQLEQESVQTPAESDSVESKY